MLVHHLRHYSPACERALIGCRLSSLAYQVHVALYTKKHMVDSLQRKQTIPSFANSRGRKLSHINQCCEKFKISFPCSPCLWSAFSCKKAQYRSGYSSMFRRFYAQKVLYSEGSMFRRSYVQKYLFRRSYV